MIANHSVHTLLPFLFFALLTLILAASPSFGQSPDKTQQAVEFFNQGQDAHEKGDLAAALNFYEKALVAFPEFPEAELQRGNALLALKRPDAAEQAKHDEAEKLLAKAIEADQMNQAALAALADLRLKNNADEKVLRELLVKL